MTGTKETLVLPETSGLVITVEYVVSANISSCSTKTHSTHEETLILPETKSLVTSANVREGNFDWYFRKFISMN